MNVLNEIRAWGAGKMLVDRLSDEAFELAQSQFASEVRTAIRKMMGN
jgi:hypothetical protein